MNKVLGVEAGEVAEAAPVAAAVAEPVMAAESAPVGNTAEVEEDDTLSYFAKLAQES